MSFWSEDYHLSYWHICIYWQIFRSKVTLLKPAIEAKNPASTFEWKLLCRSYGIAETMLTFLRYSVHSFKYVTGYIGNPFYTKAMMLLITIQLIDLINKYHYATVLYSTMYHFVTGMCTNLHISVTKWCISWYLSNAFWDLWDGSFKNGPTVDLDTRLRSSPSLFGNCQRCK